MEEVCGSISLVHVEDVCRAQLHLAESLTAAGRYIVSMTDSGLWALAAFLSSRYPHYKIATRSDLSPTSSVRFVGIKPLSLLLPPSLICRTIFSLSLSPSLPPSLLPPYDDLSSISVCVCVSPSPIWRGKGRERERERERINLSSLSLSPPLSLLHPIYLPTYILSPHQSLSPPTHIHTHPFPICLLIFFFFSLSLPPSLPHLLTHLPSLPPFLAPSSPSPICLPIIHFPPFYLPFLNPKKNILNLLFKKSLTRLNLALLLS